MAVTRLGTTTFEAGDSGSSTTLSFTLAAGTLGNRRVYCGAEYEYTAGGTPPSVTTSTFGGVAATALATSLNDLGGSVQCARIMYVNEADLPADGAQNWVFTLSGDSSPQGLRFQVWAVEGATQTAPTTFANQYSAGVDVLVPSGGENAMPAGSLASCVVAVNGSTRLSFAGSNGTWSEDDDGDGTGGDQSGGLATCAYAGATNDQVTVTMAAENRLAALMVLDIQAGGGGSTQPPRTYYTNRRRR